MVGSKKWIFFPESKDKITLDDKVSSSFKSISSFKLKVKLRKWGQFKVNRWSDQKMNIFSGISAKIILDAFVWADLVQDQIA